MRLILLHDISNLIAKSLILIAKSSIRKLHSNFINTKNNSASADNALCLPRIVEFSSRNISFFEFPQWVKLLAAGNKSYIKL